MLSALRHGAGTWKDRVEGWLISTGSVLHKYLNRFFKEENKHEHEQKTR